MAATAVMRGQMNKYCFIQSQFIVTQFYTLFQRQKSGGQAKRRSDCRGTRIVMPNRVICFVAAFYVQVVCRVMFMSLKKLLVFTSRNISISIIHTCDFEVES